MRLKFNKQCNILSVDLFQECPIGFYGQFCEQKCQCAGKYGCDHVTGACHCGPGFVGQKCDVACPPGS